GDLCGNVQRLFQRQVFVSHKLPQRLTFDKFGGDEMRFAFGGFGFADFVDGDDVRMIQSGGGSRLLQESAQAFGIRYQPDPALAANKNLLWWMAAATLPVGIAGLTLESYAETALRGPWSIGFMLIAVGLLMGYADRLPSARKPLEELTLADAMTIGLAQALAVVPGTSRSGITITAGLFRNLSRHTAARFSFLLSTPAVAAAAVKAFLDLRKAGGVSPEMVAPFTAGILVSALTGLFVISVFLKFLRNNSLRGFVLYRVFFGIMVIALAFLRRPA
ncbi:MAG: undecaprenyl-diphosphate phosphatase, partial [Bryobacterales bacterium]|nr:undecaprenyl-diphosphate phosphatase [Bryobacterales bacterium]